ncbi:hypothetical protein CSPX01_09500 [Colletotrichum filicis]|nr:hypothetical protein CSPX01_09500 [Colletotrichum filicis]
MSFVEVDACLLSGSRRQPTYLELWVEALWNWLGLDGPRKGTTSGGANPVPLAFPAGWPRNDKNLPKSIDHVIKAITPIARMKNRAGAKATWRWASRSAPRISGRSGLPRASSLAAKRIA